MDWKKLFLEWKKDRTYHYMSMRHEVIKGSEENTVLIDNTKKGSYSKVFPEAFGEKKQPIAIKIQKGDQLFDNIELFAEYTIHKKLYDMYIDKKIKVRCIKPLWLRWVRFNRGPPVLTFAMEPFSNTLYEHIKHTGDTEQTRRWKEEIISEVKRLNKDWDFFHRDLHISNVGVKNNDWIFFDFGMAMFGDIEPHYGHNIHIYEKGYKPCIGHDERLLRFSWSGFGDRDREYVHKERKKIYNSQCILWQRNMPVNITNYEHMKKGLFIKEESDDNLLIEIKVKLPPRKRRRINNNDSDEDFDMVSEYVSIPKKHVKPNIYYEFIQYYTPQLI